MYHHAYPIQLKETKLGYLIPLATLLLTFLYSTEEVQTTPNFQLPGSVDSNQNQTIYRTFLDNNKRLNFENEQLLPASTAAVDLATLWNFYTRIK